MGYYTKKILDKFAAAYSEARKNIDNIHVTISKANSKMGAVASVSMLPFLTCPSRCGSTCGMKCYAAKLANLRQVVLKSYANNTAIAVMKPDMYWKEIDKACSGIKYFRFHVSGDIINAQYLQHMVQIAKNHPGTEFLAFTKRYEIVNDYLNEHRLPTNLHILFSGWTNLTPDNPHALPETNVIEHGKEPEEAWKICSGNCFNCAKAGTGCWTAQPGDVIAFHMH